MSEIQKPESFKPAASVLNKIVKLYDVSSPDKPSEFITSLIGRSTDASFRRTRTVNQDENVFYFETLHRAVLAVRSNALTASPDFKKKKWKTFIDLLRKELLRWDDEISHNAEEVERLMDLKTPRMLIRHWLTSTDVIEVGLGDVQNSRRNMQFQIQDMRERARGNIPPEEFSNCPDCISEGLHKNPFDKNFCIRHLWCNESEYVGWTFWRGTTKPMCAMKHSKSVPVFRMEKKPEEKQSPTILIDVITLSPERPSPDSFTDIERLKRYGNSLVTLYKDASEDLILLPPSLRDSAEKSLEKLKQYIDELRERKNKLEQE